MFRTIYLCGPIFGCTDEECKDWRDYVTNLWKDDFPLSERKTLDPMRRDYRGRTDDFYEELVELDKIDVMNSDVILVNYDKPSVGTSMEIMYAWERGKLVVVVTKEGTPISPWMLYHSHKIAHSFLDAINYIEGLNK